MREAELTRAGTGTCDIRVSRGSADPQWDVFVLSCPDGHHEQTSLWGRVKAAYGWQPVRLVLRSGDQIIGGAQVLTRGVGRLGTVAHVCKGPLVMRSDPHLVARVVDELHRFGRKSRWAYLAVELPSDGEHVAGRLD